MTQTRIFFYFFAWSVWNIQYSVWNIQYSVWNIQYSVWNVQYSVWNIQYSVWNIQYSVWNIQYSVGNIQYSVGNIQYSVGNIQYSVGNIQYSVWNIQFHWKCFGISLWFLRHPFYETYKIKCLINFPPNSKKYKKIKGKVTYIYCLHYIKYKLVEDCQYFSTK